MWFGIRESATWANRAPAEILLAEKRTSEHSSGFLGKRR
jgi:hypothetical protein